MLTVHAQLFERARAIVEGEGMRILREVREHRAGERSAREVTFEGTLRHVRGQLVSIGIPEIVMLGYDRRVADSNADEEGAEATAEVLCTIGCDFIGLRDWRPDT